LSHCHVLKYQIIKLKDAYCKIIWISLNLWFNGKSIIKNDKNACLEYKVYLQKCKFDLI